MNKKFSNLRSIYKHLETHEYLDYRYYHLPHSSVTYARYLVKQKFDLDISPERMQDILYWEGMLPAEEYGMPAWYIKKHMTPIHVTKRREEIKALGKLTTQAWKPTRKKVAQAIK